MAPAVKALEEQIIERVNEAVRAFYAQVFAVFQERWLEQRPARCVRERWRAINQVTPFWIDLFTGTGGAFAATDII